MKSSAPHLVQYQGSKRLLAPQILSFVKPGYDRLIEPFSGTAAISIAASMNDVASTYLINDLNEPLVAMLKEAIEFPERLALRYEEIWIKQFNQPDPFTHVDHFYQIRKEFNAGNRCPANMLYLLARVVKGAVRYDSKGMFNQSPDKRRHGAKPEKIQKNVHAISSLLKGKTEFYSSRYEEILEKVQENDLVYLDPPYQGVSFTRDHRYFSGVTLNEFSQAIDYLNKTGADYIISYDGACGEKVYGTDLPLSLGCTKILLRAGRSAQATMLGRDEITLEGLYLSPRLAQKIRKDQFIESEAGMVYQYAV